MRNNIKPMPAPALTQLRVSIVLPVYNEADRLRDCLQTVVRQTVQPYEIIVVDNNSTDGSAAIARSFARHYPFVRVVREARQGVVYARRRGFDEARGDVLGSIDADTVLPADWVEQAAGIFADDDVQAVAGVVRYRDIAWAPAVNRVDLSLRRTFAYLYEGRVPVQGANMALRRSAWQAVRGQLCYYAGLHEDLDMAVHLGEIGRGARLDERLLAEIGSRQCALTWRDFVVYGSANPRSYGRHGLSVKVMWCVVAAVISLYPVLWILHKGYDADGQRFSWSRVFRPTGFTKINPVTFVD